MATGHEGSGNRPGGQERLLTIGQRAGKFPGMLKERTFRVIFVSSGHGAGGAAEEKPDTIVHYTGKAVSVPAPR